MSDPQILQLFGLLFLAAGTGMFLHAKFYVTLFKEHKSNPAMSLLTGIITFILGYLVVMNHFRFSDDIATSTITIIGYLSFISGLSILAIPATMTTTISKVAPLSKHVRIWAAIIFVLGLIISYLGFCS